MYAICYVFNSKKIYIYIYIIMYNNYVYAFIFQYTVLYCSFFLMNLIKTENYPCNRFLKQK